MIVDKNPEKEPVCDSVTISVAVFILFPIWFILNSVIPLKYCVYPLIYGNYEKLGYKELPSFEFWGSIVIFFLSPTLLDAVVYPMAICVGGCVLCLGGLLFLGYTGIMMLVGGGGFA